MRMAMAMAMAWPATGLLEGDELRCHKKNGAMKRVLL